MDEFIPLGDVIPMELREEMDKETQLTFEDRMNNYVINMLYKRRAY